jgi:anaerobic selenocysteine-containing dehydrogenase
MPNTPGMDTMACIDAAERGEIDLAVCLGGNLFASNPDLGFASRALRNAGLVVYLSTTMNTGHCCGLGRETLVLPVRVRDEESQSTTQESMFNFIRYSDGGPARHEGPRAEVDIVCDLGEQVLGDEPIDWNAMRNHDSIRSMIGAVVPGFESIAGENGAKKEFTIKGRVFHEPSFPTETGRANFHVVEIPRVQLAENELLLMTVRSEGQFNTVVYEEEDLYRGQERRDVVLMNEGDMARLSIEHDQAVTVSSNVGSMQVIARTHDIASGCACMYYPEANMIVPKTIDAKSRTPAFKSVVVAIEPS